MHLDNSFISTTLCDDLARATEAQDGKKVVQHYDTSVHSILYGLLSDTQLILQSSIDMVSLHYLAYQLGDPFTPCRLEWVNAMLTIQCCWIHQQVGKDCFSCDRGWQKKMMM